LLAVLGEKSSILIQTSSIDYFGLSVIS